MTPGLSLYQIVIGFLNWLGSPAWLSELLYRVLVGLLMMGFIALVALFLIWMLRKEMGRMQLRIGPNVLGPAGIFQTSADALKILLKEDIVPAKADRPMFILAPYLGFLAAGMTYMVIPLGPRVIVNDLNVGLLFFVAFGSLTALSILIAGWGSNNKYSLVGGMRSVAQMVSYEVPMVIALLGPVLLAGTLSTVGIVEAQSSLWFIILQPLGFLIYFVAGLAETNQTPFDLPEGESELIAGFHVEYSGMRFALFFLSEFAATFAIAAMTATLFLGGWSGPLLPPVVWFLIKTLALVFVMMWIRSTWPRFRIDQVMGFTWKVLLPLALLNVLIAAVEVVLIHGFGA